MTSLPQRTQPGTKELFNTLHTKLGLKREENTVKMQSHKMERFKKIRMFFDAFVQHQLPVAESNVRHSAIGLASAASHMDVVNKMRNRWEISAIHPLGQFYIGARRGMYGQEFAEQVQELDTLLSERYKKMPTAPGEQMPPLCLNLVSGMNAQLMMTAGIFNVIPRVAKEKYDTTLSSDEWSEIARNSISVIRPSATTHQHVLDYLLSLYQPQQADHSKTKTNEYQPYETEPFILSEHAGRKVIDISQETFAKLYAILEENRAEKNLFNEPMIGCIANEIIPRLHRALHASAETSLFPLIDKQQTLPVR